MAVYKHQTDQKLRENKEFISAVVDSIGDGVIATNSQGEVTYMNAFAEKIIGCTSKVCYGRNHSDVFVVAGDDLWSAEMQMEFLRQSMPK